VSDSQKALFLFDIDGTLISPGKTARSMFVEIVKELTGKEVTLEVHQVAGFTDPKILENMLQRAGLNKNEIHQAMEKFFLIYYERLENRYNSSEDKFIFSDISENLPALNDEDNIYLGLVTGNMERAAMIKLSPFGLNKYFNIGAFASDKADRNELPPIAVARAEALWEKKFENDEIFVVGDTIYDVECAVHNSYRAIGIARRNGEKEMEQLKNAGATWVYKSLPDISQLMAIANLN